MGLFDTVVDFATGRRDRDHGEHREDRMRLQDRAWFERDRRNQRQYDAGHLQRLRTDAKAAGLHPLAALGAQVAGPATTFMSQSYGGGGSPGFRSSISDGGASDVNKAHARLLNKQADLIEDQITASSMKRLTPKNEDMAKPYDITPQTFTPVLDHAVFGEAIKSDPTVADAQAHTTRGGESEMYETILGAVINAKDYLYNKSGLNWRKRMGANKFYRSMKKDNSRKWLKRTAKQHYRFD